MDKTFSLTSDLWMKPGISRTGFRMARVAAILRYRRCLQASGAPVGTILARAGISSELIDHPAALLPLETVLSFVDLACQTLETEHLGLRVGLTSSLDGLGPYGRMLENSLTVHEYVRTGISLYDMLVTGQRLWLSEHGEDLRINFATVGESDVGKYQAQLETLVVTIGKIREAAGPEWCPREISLAYRAREPIPAIEHFFGSRVFQGTGETWFTLPRSMMGLRFPGRGGIGSAAEQAPAWGKVPNDLPGLVQLQIQPLLSCRQALQIGFVAESLGMSTRSLQRALASEGLSYSQLRTETQIRQAARWLEHTDKPVSEIAFDLCYTDASNFTRAFRLQTGVSPLAFRRNANGR